ncbi:centromere protein J isoform X2 [Orussus abietinus]|uniref:centromere protein J isoform X2 n=1 Tax=Orussus abietinus TaxID=222816 RepID=UPI000625E355|nr:centromere protein J isoform X2 [Orussus abietinus]
MALEASILERLQELRRWQTKQQEQLLKQQEEQRDLLSREQERMYKALNLSVQSDSLDESVVNKILIQNKEEGNCDLTEVSVESSSKQYFEKLHDETEYLSFQHSHTELDLQRKPGLTEKCLDTSAECVITGEKLLNSGKTLKNTSKVTDNLSPIQVRIDCKRANVTEGTSITSSVIKPDMLLSVPSMQLVSNNDIKKFAEVKQQIDTEYDAMQIKSELDFTPSKHQSAMSKFMIEGVELLPAEKSLTGRITIDDIPVPSPKKDFQTLLEERLRDSEAIISVNESESNPKRQVKRPFLRKGDGLARFKLNSRANDPKKSYRPRSTSLSANLKNPKTDSESQKETVKLKNISSKRSVTIPNVPQQKLSLKHITPPNKKSQSKSLSLAPSIQLNTSNEQMKRLSELNNSDIESKINREMEESVQSTPLRSKKTLEKNVQQRALSMSIKTSHDNIKDPSTPEKINNKDKRTLVLSEWDSIPLPNQNGNEGQSSASIGIRSKKFSSYEVQHTNDSNTEHSSFTDTDQEHICQLPYGTDIDPLCLRDYVKTIGENANNENNVSLHVRFSEYNEYKTIGLTDTSSISNDSQQPTNYAEDKAWSDYSTSTDSSDAESVTTKLEVQKNNTCINNIDSDLVKDVSNVLQSRWENLLDVRKHQSTLHDKSKEFKRLKCISEDQNSDPEVIHSETDDGTYTSDYSYQESYSDYQNPEVVLNDDTEETILDTNNEVKDCDLPGHNSEMPLNKYTSSSNNQETSVSVNVRESESTVFNSELLKSRLLELEKEITIFRKENVALTIQRQKLQEEQKELQKLFKEKERTFEENRTREENNLKEEKKRLAREKAALENRMKVAQQQAQVSKQQRQEVQVLKEELEELREEISQKESRWYAAQARQRSQVRILQTENSKLKQEVARLQNLRRNNTKFRKTGVSDNTRAIHKISKQLEKHKQPLSKEEFLSDEDEKLLQPMMDALQLNGNDKDNTRAQKITDKHSNKGNDYAMLQKSLRDAESISKKRNMYKNLLKDATNDIEESSEMIAKKTEYQNATEQLEEQHANEVNLPASNIHTEFKEAHFNQVNSCPEDKCQEETTISNKSTKCTLNDSMKSHYSQKITSSEEPSYEPYGILKKNNTPNEQIGEQLNKQGVREVHHSDGRIEYWYPNGNVKKIFPDRTVTKMIYYNGDVCERSKDGMIKYFYAATRTWHTTMPEGLEILEFPDGQVERRSKNGAIEISFPDGTVKIVESDGSEKWALADGTIAETLPNGEKVLSLPNGQREIHATDHKRREYPDGTVKLVYTDGSQETRYASGRVRLKDKDGNVLMDSHLQ